MPARSVILSRLYRKASDIGSPVVALIPTNDVLPPVDPVEVARSMRPGARYTIEALAVGLADFYDNPDPAMLDRIRKDLDVAASIFNQED